MANELEYTPSAAIERKYKSVVNGFFSGVTKSVPFRQQQLRNLYYAVLDHEQELKDALYADLQRAPQETEILELNQIVAEASLAITNVESWSKPEKMGMLCKDIRFALSSCSIEKSPYGTVLIIGPWNYPYLCTLGPIIAAIAAGNSIMFKPSEITVNSTKILVQILEAALDETVFQVTVGGVEETTQLLGYKWDKIMLTGSTKVGKIVARSAAESLTPCCLELGGKSPLVVTKNADLKLIAKRAAWGKLVNSGQTCIAPDYAIVEHEVADEFQFRMQEAIKELYPTLEIEGSSPDYAKIVSERNFGRINTLVSETKGTVWQICEPNKETLFYPPTLVRGVDVTDSLMQEELFGPVLPIIEVEDVIGSAPLLIGNYNDTPLVVYICTADKREQTELVSRIRAGAVCINDCLIQGGSPALPFGGVGSSGCGKYHGKYGFDEFSTTRAVVNQSKLAELVLNARYPPYTKFNGNLVRWVSRPLQKNFPREGAVEGDADGRTFKQLIYVYVVGFAVSIYYFISFAFQSS